MKNNCRESDIITIDFAVRLQSAHMADMCLQTKKFCSTLHMKLYAVKKMLYMCRCTWREVLWIVNPLLSELF